LGEDGSGFSGTIGGAPVRLRIGREDVESAEGIEVWVEVDRELGSALGNNMGGGAPTPAGDGTKMIEIVAISTKKTLAAAKMVLNENTRLDMMNQGCRSDFPVRLARCRPTPHEEMTGWKILQVV
jgi:hypothetical protein